MFLLEFHYNLFVLNLQALESVTDVNLSDSLYS